jgi:NADPH:quinone reductase-like Zn-dependent oxidoreductase
MTVRSKVLTGVLLLVVFGLTAFALALSHNSPCGTAPALAADTQSMKAAVHRCYGSPDVVKIEEIAKPIEGEHGVLIRVHAASVNPLDWHLLRGQPYIVRMMGGWGAPGDTSLGVDFAGTVEQVGKSVTRFKPGDEVFGGANGSLAQYVRLRETSGLALKPANVTFEQAAAVAVAGSTALQALRDQGQLRAGQKVVINGAGGGVGTFAVQIAKALGAEVTAVTSTSNLDLVRSIGADHVIDYTREDFTTGTNRYDLIVDCGGNHPLSAYRRVLTPAGTYVMCGEINMGNWIEPFARMGHAVILSKVTDQKFVPFISNLNEQDMTFLRDLMESGKLKPVIDRRYPLDQTGEALAYLEKGHARGKVIITVD